VCNRLNANYLGVVVRLEEGPGFRALSWAADTKTRRLLQASAPRFGAFARGLTCSRGPAFFLGGTVVERPMLQPGPERLARDPARVELSPSFLARGSYMTLAGSQVSRIAGSAT